MRHQNEAECDPKHQEKTEQTYVELYNFFRNINWDAKFHIVSMINRHYRRICEVRKELVKGYFRRERGVKKAKESRDVLRR